MHRTGTKHIVRHMQKICRTVVCHIQVNLYILVILLHSRIGTPKELVKMNLSDDPGCGYYQDPSETMLLAFVNCLTVKDVLEGSEGWLQSIVDPHIKLGDFEKKNIGWDSPENIISRVIVVTTQTIYQKRQLGKP